jgi:hypothetical protein
MNNFSLTAKQLADLLSARTVSSVEALLGALQPVRPEEYHRDYKGPVGKWQHGRLHWLPVGLDRGNSGRIKLAGQPANPIVERTVNGMEAIIELRRQLELLLDPSTPMPISPREAALRYFGLPRLDEIPRITDVNEAKKALQAVKAVRSRRCPQTC